eukprot:Clim_evm73s142 gene=Clim_evmTU73s142
MSVILYMSSVSGSMAVKKQTQSISTLLEAHKIPYTMVDVSLSENEDKKIHMTDISGKRTLPQVHVGDEYIGGWEEIEMANEDGRLRHLLRST